jgi:CRISPR-associated endonuclease/helicase Cas3
MDYIAHVRKLDNGDWDKPQSLEEHLQGVAEIAAEFAGKFDSAEWGYALGLLHDTGKGTAEWQAYLREKSDYEEVSTDAPGKCEHSGPGAKLAEELFGKAGRFLSYCIAGHHAGLPDWSGTPGSLQFRLQNNSAQRIAEEFRTTVSTLCPKAPPWKFDPNGLDMPLWIRMLFSCLIDADRLDTERYMNPEQYRERQDYCSIAELGRRFDAYMTKKTQQTPNTNTTVYHARQQVLADCQAAVQLEPGLFSLTVPTGGGKTLSSMAFALEHAIKYHKDRILYGGPYTSIIEQNADVFREVFGDDEILEHHANLDDDERTVRSRLAAENWDAPIIVTTNVQFFESLFAAKTSRCRKIHNIANSVVILDEAQLIPIDFLHPILDTMRLLTEHYGVTFVLCTATQPVFEKQKAFPAFPGLEEGSVREIIQDVQGLYKSLERVNVKFPKDDTPVEWRDLASELAALPQTLCVVSDRKSCRELHAEMPKGTHHLSALMCAQHRSEVIAAIKGKLKRGEGVRVISTQLVEAGVDIDFPVVYRAMAGLDSIAQAAGRCNREGKLNESGLLGRVVVFHAPRKPPVGALRKAAQTAQAMCEGGLATISDPKVFTPYFTQVYWKANSLDSKDIMELLKPDQQECGIQFRSATEEFKLIDDKAQRSIVVPYGEGEKYITLLKNSKISAKKLLRKLQRYTINMYNYQFEQMQRRGSLEEIYPGVFALNNTVEYSAETGLLVDEMPNDPNLFMC